VLVAPDGTKTHPEGHRDRTGRDQIILDQLFNNG
jgi:hypothetical protein